MPEDCTSYKLRLRIEYSRLCNWANLSGLTTDHERFNRRVKLDRITILAVLHELRMSLKKLRKLSIRYNDIHIGQSPDPTRVDDATADLDATVTEKDMLDIWEVMTSVPAQVPQSSRGRITMHVRNLSTGIRDVVRHPERVRWALRDREGFDRELARLTGFVNSLQDTLDESQMTLILQNTLNA